MASNTLADLAKLRQLSADLDGSSKKLKTMNTKILTIKKRVEKAVNDAGYMENIIKARFDKEAARSTGALPWKARKDDTGDEFSEHPILHKTGALLHSALRAVKGTYHIDKTWFHIFMVSVAYGKYHQFGTGKLPPRPFMLDPTKQELRPADMYANNMIKKYLKELFK